MIPHGPHNRKAASLASLGRTRFAGEEAESSHGGANRWRVLRRRRERRPDGALRPRAESAGREKPRMWHLSLRKLRAARRAPRPLPSRQKSARAIFGARANLWAGAPSPGSHTDATHAHTRGARRLSDGAPAGRSGMIPGQSFRASEHLESRGGANERGHALCQQKRRTTTRFLTE